MKYIHILFFLLLLSSCTLNDDLVDLNGDVTINIVAKGLSKHNVTTRGSDAKDTEEKEIKSLYIFIYDETDDDAEICNYIEGDASDATSILSASTMTGKTNCVIYAVANVGRDMFEKKENGYPTNALTLGAIKSISYTVDDIVSLDIPETGIPMVGALSGVDMSMSNVYTVEMKALMARIDLNLALEADHTNATYGYPAMRVNDVVINNIPTSVPFVIPTTTSATEFKSVTKTINSTTIYNSDAQLSYSFYVFENLQGIKKPTIPTGAENYSQNYKPRGADDNDMHLVFNSIFTDVNGNEYDVAYTLYLGANHTNDFNVKRNYQYINNVTIKGIAKTSLHLDNIYSYDARVEVSTTTTGKDDFYISMLNERDLDAHYAVVPMDIYLLDGDGIADNGKVTVSIESDGEYGVPGWLRLEAPDGFNGTAYSGVRDYFTTDLVTNTLNANTSVTPAKYVDGSKGQFCRVYIYVDENTTTKDYEATIKVTNGTKTKYITLRQLGLIQVDYVSVEKDSSGNYTVYMERYEEYLEHWDPLDVHASTRVYQGLPWQHKNWERVDAPIGGTSQTDLYARQTGYAAVVYVDGLTLTQAIYNTKEMGNLFWKKTYGYGYNQQKKMSDGIPETASAAEYCYDKNKKQSNGKVSESFDLKEGWYLPAIRELENGLEQNYTLYPEFQGDFYWSSAPAKTTVGEETTRARATKVVPSGNEWVHAESGSPDDAHNYTDKNGTGGRADRDEVFRVRAFWKGTPAETRPYSIKAK